MAEFKVVRVVDGDTFDVSPEWRWSGQTGDRVRAAGYDTPELGTALGLSAKSKLEKLLLGKIVELGNAYRIDRGRLVCEVYFGNSNLKDYFHEYR
jgi:endonuclease YncB( thermonuclease family)